MNIREILGMAPVVPVLTVTELDYAVPLARALAAGGVAMLQALGAPFPDVLFCPTGGITRATAADYLALPNVICVGGSWVAPKAMLEAADWSGIEALARDAASLRKS